MMHKQKSLIGMEISSTTHMVESGQIKLLKNALHRPNPYIETQNYKPYSPELSGVLPCFLLGNLIDLPTIYKTLSLNIKNVLLSRETVISHRQVCTGDEVSVRTFLTNVYEQQATSNPIGFVLLDSVGSTKNNVAFICERILAVRGGFKRGSH